MAVGGIGKVAAAMTAQYLCDAYHPGGLVAFGLAGAATSAAGRGQVIIASGAVQHDMDARPFLPTKGVVPGFESAIFEADPKLSRVLTEAGREAIEHPDAVHTGLVLTGDQIVTSAQMRDRLANEFPDVACIDMETAAVAQVAHQNALPWGAVRITSDAADESFDLEAVFGFGMHTASDLFERIIRGALTRL